MNSSSKRILRPRKKDLSGKTLYGKYRLGDRIGGDRCCVLYAAEDLVNRRKAAIAVLEPGVGVEPSLGAAAHPNLVAVQEVIEKDGQAKFVVTDLPPGKSLEAVLAKRGALEPPIAITTTMQILAALHAIHGRERIHGSLEPGNVFLERNDEEQLLATLVDVALVAESGLPDDPRYMSPEQVIGEGGVDRRTDIWTVGVLLHEMLFDRLPFDGGDRDEISGKILLKEAQIDTPSDDIPEDLIGFIAKALSKEPDNRHENVTAAQGDLLFVNEEFEDMVGPAAAAALRESIAPPPVPPAALKTTTKPKDLPPALDLFGKPGKAPAKGPPPLPPRQGPPPPPDKGPPPLPENKPFDAAVTMQRIDRVKSDEEDKITVADEEERETVPKDPTKSDEAKAEPEDDEERPTPLADAVDLQSRARESDDEDVRVTDPVEPAADAVDAGWERDSIEGRTTLPAPSGVFEELDSLAVAEESRRVATEVDRETEAGAADAPPAAGPAVPADRRPGRPTLIAAGIAVVAVACFIGVLLYVFSGEEETPADPVASADPGEPEPTPPPEPPRPQEPKPTPPQVPQPAQPDTGQPPALSDAPEQPEPSVEPEPSAADDEEITLSLNGVPEGALIKINGKRAEQPIRIRKAKKSVTLGIYLAGYHSHWERFVPKEDLVIEVKMPKKKKGTGGAGKGEGTWADNPWKR